MRSLVAGMAAGIFIVGLLPVFFWIQVVRHGGRIKTSFVTPIVVAMLTSLLLCIFLDPFTAKFVLPTGAAVVVSICFYVKWKHSKGRSGPGGPFRRIPAQAKRPVSHQVEEEVPRKAAGSGRGRFRGELA